VKTTFLTLDDVRAQATRIFVVICWIHVGFAAAVAALARNDILIPVAVTLTAAAIVTVCAWQLRDGLALRCIVAVCLTVGPIVFVYAARGHANGISGTEDWQIDYHMYFFAVFAMLAAYVDWRPIALAAGLTAVHHLLLDLFVPANVFPQEGLDRVVLHALAVVAECSVLFWLTYQIDALFKRVEEANALVELTSEQTAEALALQMAENATLKAQLDLLLGELAVTPN
jgi:methyl-accepting chemotaxis protein